jgi:hypothetical protein
MVSNAMRLVRGSQPVVDRPYHGQREQQTQSMVSTNKRCHGITLVVMEQYSTIQRLHPQHYTTHGNKQATNDHSIPFPAAMSSSEESSTGDVTRSLLL